MVEKAAPKLVGMTPIDVLKGVHERDLTVHKVEFCVVIEEGQDVPTHRPPKPEDLREGNYGVMTFWLRPVSTAQMERAIDKSIVTSGRGRKSKTEVKGGRYSTEEVTAAIAKWDGVVDDDGSTPSKISVDRVHTLPSWVTSSISNKLADMAEVEEEDSKNL